MVKWAQTGNVWELFSHKWTFFKECKCFFAGEVNIHAEIFIQILLNETKEAETI